MSNWIKVSDKLPESDVGCSIEYLVYLRNGDIIGWRPGLGDD